jgi:uncharacterized protein
MLPDVQKLLEELAHTPSLICTVSRDGAVSELFLDGDPRKVEFSGAWATVEFTGWHIHVDLGTIVRIRFDEAQSHEDSMSAYVSCDDGEGKAVLRFYFPHPSHTYRTYTAEELGLFEKFKKKYQKEVGSRS